MKTQRILTTTTDIQKEVVRLMKPGTRRIAIVAFVGVGAHAYIPHPEGATIICWPKTGGTTPNAIRELIKRGAEVRFADKLHMKLYWAKDRGALIGSANLSTNALGAGGLKELAVCLTAESVKIDRILESINSRPVTKKDLRKLELAHKKLGHRFAGSEAAVNYLTWFNSLHRTNWKIGWWSKQVAHSKAAVKKAKEEFGQEPKAGICGRKVDYRDLDWILSFGLKGKSVTQAEWIYANFVVQSSKSKKAEHPFDAVQTYSNRERPTPPFALTKRFKKALTSACKKFGIDKLKNTKSVQPPANLLRLLRDEM